MAARSKFQIGVAASGSILLGSLSLPSLIASLTTVSVDATLEEIRAGEPPLPHEVIEAAKMSYAAAAWAERGRHLTNTALAMSTLLPEEQRRLARDLPSLAIVVEEALAAEPVAPFNWYRLAQSRRMAGDLPGASASWRMSVLSGRLVPRLVEARLELGLALMSGQDGEGLALLADQVRLVAAENVEALVEIGRRQRAMPFIRVALGDDTRRLSELSDAERANDAGRDG